MRLRTTLVRLAGAVTFSCAFASMPQQASASVVLTGCAGGSFGNACSLGELVAGGSMLVNDVQFSGFALDAFAGRPLDPAVIRVDPIDTLFRPGFTLVDTVNTLAFSNDFTLNNLLYNVTALSNTHPVSQSTLAMAVGSLTGDNSIVHVSEQLFDPSLVNVLGVRDAFCNDAITPACANSVVTEAGALVPPVNALSVQALIDVFGDTTGVARINSVTMQFAQVPEPGSLALVAFGIAAVAGRVRRRKMVQP